MRIVNEDEDDEGLIFLIVPRLQRMRCENGMIASITECLFTAISNYICVCDDEDDDS